MDGIPTIPEFYKGKNIFITGGTGFIGKVLIEKLLRSCPDVQNLYLLMRAKKGKSAEERLKAVTDLPLYDVLRKERPDAFQKIKIVLGDVVELGLGLSDEDRQTLIDEVHVVIHGAASVRFDDPLSDAIIMNTRGTREMCHLALEMKQLIVLAHISTTYCNTDRKVIDEQLYPPHADWRKSIKIAENADKQTLNVLTKKYMGTLPNTYTFAKSLAEHVVDDLCGGKIPVLILRPSIVISTMKEPFPGWVDNFNGPIGILVACGKGVVRTMYTKPHIVADYIPVDIVVKGSIIATWKKATTLDPEDLLSVAVYNGANNNFQPVTIKEVVEIGKSFNWEYPLNDILWYPAGGATGCWYEYYIKFMFYQLLPAVFIDGMMKLTGHKPLLVKIQRKIYTATCALEYFITNEWQFKNGNSDGLENYLLPSDVKDFGYYKDDFDVFRYFKDATIGIRHYLLKEDDSTLEAAKAHNKRMWVIHMIFNCLWYAGLLWLIFFKVDILSIFAKKYNDTILYLTTE